MTSSPKLTKQRTPAHHIALDRMPYDRTHRLQWKIHTLRQQGCVPDTIITVEHDPVFTLGRSAKRDNLLVSASELAKQGIQVQRVERGGDITYHGPGQLVVYPIIDLREHGRSIKTYIHNLEQAIIDTLEFIGIQSSREEGLPGVWIGERKIASIGVHVKRWITLHGLALNVDSSDRYFRMVRPCGMDIQMTSINELLATTHGIDDIAQLLLSCLQQQFGWSLTEEPAASYLEDQP